MVDSLTKVIDDLEVNKRFMTDKIEDLANVEMDYFINENSLKLFERFGINKQFLNCDVESRNTNPHYLNGRIIFKNMLVVNDVAERGVKLAEEYVNILTKNEEQKQFIGKIVSEYKKKYPNPCKKNPSK